LAIAPYQVPLFFIVEPVSLIIGGGTGGLLTGLIWQRAEPSVRGRQVLIVTVGWTIGLLLGALIPLVNVLTIIPQFRSGIDYTLIGIIGSAIGSGVMAWQLRRARRAG
jgi:hypothetical protein